VLAERCNKWGMKHDDIRALATEDKILSNLRGYLKDFEESGGEVPSFVEILAQRRKARELSKSLSDNFLFFKP